MHKNRECDWSGGAEVLRDAFKRGAELCQEGHEGYGYKGGNGTGPLCLEKYYWRVRPVLARMPENTVCVLGSRTLNEYQ